jgi:hypothetical protein
MLLALGLGPVIAFGCGHARPTSAELDLLRAEGNPVVSAIQAWTKGHGRPPSGFEELGMEPQTVRGWKWIYTRSEDGGSWQLKVGDYFGDGFVLYWKDANGGWHVDM